MIFFYNRRPGFVKITKTLDKVIFVSMHVAHAVI